jgi:CRISPR/Cas system endoribonuclease Cas6 (RAMP superfamily)
MAPGDEFWFDLHLFAGRPDLLAYFVLAFRQLGVEGVGPGRARVELVRVNSLDSQGNPEAAVFENGSLAASPGGGIPLPLVGEPGANGVIRLQFLSPTEFKEAGSVALRPEFGPLFRRIANRISNLGTLYQEGRPLEGLTQLTQASDRMRIVGGTVSWAQVERRSSKTGQRHSLGGFTGWVDYEGDYGPFLPWLQAARWTGVGRQTVWGKGWMEAAEVRAANA